MRGGERMDAEEDAALRIGLLVESFPVATETFVATEARALAELGHPPVVEARVRPPAGDARAVEDVRARWAQDDTRARRARAALWLLARAPRAAARDLLARRRWRREEWVPPLRWLAPVARRLDAAGVTHLHAHFARGAALDALRLSRLLGLPYSVQVHGWDVYARPANLREKLDHAAWVSAPCHAMARDVRDLGHDSAPIHVVVMGVDPETFGRTRPHGDERRVVAVGRLVEKKGFPHLLDAAALVDGPLEVVVIGDGPLRRRLEERARRGDLAGRVSFLGTQPPDRVRAELERATLVAVPSVRAADGDLDSMPVIAKEALAMEVPVVASDIAGLPELVRPEWGRLVPPGEPPALARAIEELLALPASDRAKMGSAGRAHVVSHCSARGEAARLIALIAGEATP